MALSSLDGYIAAAKQRVTLLKTASRTGLAGIAESVFDVAGNPGAGTLAGTSTASGVVPTDATLGCPKITNFGGSAVGYLSKVEFGSQVASRINVFDMLFKAGAYAYNTTSASLSSQPSYSGRLAASGDYKGLEIWLEVSTAFLTGNAWTIQVGYTNQDGTDVNTPVLSFTAANLILGRMVQIPLNPGDTAVQKIVQISVVNGGTAMTAGAYNILVLRRLWSGRVNSANNGGTHDLLSTGMPIVFEDSALIAQVVADSTATGIFELTLEIANA